MYLYAQERHELGRSRRSTMPRSAFANYVADEHRPDPIALLESQDGSRIADLRTNARVAVRVLSRRCDHHGVRLGRAPAHRPRGPVVRRRTPVQLRYVRIGRAQSGVRHRRLRRDVARAMGMGRQEAGGQSGGCSAWQRIWVYSARARGSRVRTGVPGSDASFRGHA